MIFISEVLSSYTHGQEVARKCRLARVVAFHRLDTPEARKHARKLPITYTLHARVFERRVLLAYLDSYLALCSQLSQKMRVFSLYPADRWLDSRKRFCSAEPV